MNAEDMRALLDPTGTKMERLARVVACAKALGFGKAYEAWWDGDNPASPIDCPEAMADGECGVFEVEVGVFLSDSVFVECHESENETEDDYVTSVHDTRESAEAVAKV